MKIFYIGDSNANSTSRQRAMALIRLGHSVQHYDARNDIRSLSSQGWLYRLHYRTGYRLLQHKVSQGIANTLKRVPKPDLIWVNGGELLSPHSVRILSAIGVPVVLYNNDDPTGRRDGQRFHLLRKSIPHYSLCAVLREVNIEEYLRLGAKRVLRIWMSYDEVEHAPRDQFALPTDDVAFIGTRIPGDDREFFLARLLSLGVNVRIRGSRWDSCRNEMVRRAVASSAVYGRAYAEAIQNSKLSLGLLSKGNRDQHTRRSMEIPFAGGLLCAERTQDHLALFKDGVEAVFWSNVEECASVCLSLLTDDRRRNAIRDAGIRRIRELGVGNEDVLRQVISTAFSPEYTPTSRMHLQTHAPRYASRF